MENEDFDEDYENNYREPPEGDSGIEIFVLIIAAAMLVGLPILAIILG